MLFENEYLVSSDGESLVSNFIIAKENFFRDLSNYVPLGCLTFRTESSNDLATQRIIEHSEIATPPTDFQSHRLWQPLYDLATHKWIRIFKRECGNDRACCQVYCLPDDVGRRYVNRNSRHLRKALSILVNKLDRSPLAWAGQMPMLQHDSTSVVYSPIETETSKAESLFYIFNTLPSPPRGTVKASDPYSNEAIQDIIQTSRLHGLRTRLYPYQKRSVVTMIRREVTPARTLDPRLQTMIGPTQQVFYYDSETDAVLRDKREYEVVSGGILGESMGLGKTLMCLALVLSTKGHWPSAPPEFSIEPQYQRMEVGSLKQMAARATADHLVPWRSFFQGLSAIGEDHGTCKTLLERNPPSYVVPTTVSRASRSILNPHPGKTVTLCTATIIIVPQNLVGQWKAEIGRHVEIGALNVLYLDSYGETKLPSVDDLLKLDILLMPRQRLEQEMIPPESCRFAPQGGTEYESPLKRLHFLRVIMDEGHEFASYGSRNKCYWALQELRVDRKWIVSGTPAASLIGVEVETAISERSRSQEQASLGDERATVLLKRRNDLIVSQERKDLEKLGGIVTGFLKMRPWANSKEDDPASWSKYILPHEDGTRKSQSLRALLESLVVRHRIEHIEVDLHLPPLYNQVTYLEPCWYDKLSINLFILSLVANAVTSERVDEDYMFHQKNRHSLNQLINNLRQSGFYWTSFGPDEIEKTLRVSQTYLDEHAFAESEQTPGDRALLTRAIEVGGMVLKSKSWKAFANLHEMGMFVEDFPSNAKDAWSLHAHESQGSTLIGASQLLKAQQWMDNNLWMSDPTKMLASIGTTTMRKAWDDSETSNGNNSLASPEKHSETSPTVSLATKNSTGTPKLTERHTISRAKISTPSCRARKSQAMSDSWYKDAPGPSTKPKPILKSALKSAKPSLETSVLPVDSVINTTRLIGTASAKLSYLLDRVVALHSEEKILIFYDGDHIAWYLAQGLDILAIRYLIYTPKLSQARQNSYITTFNATDTFRVLLMDIHQAAHGLHIACASRVFFVNPVWQPNIEAQAIKRAHRIGQTRPVYVETLVLKDTLEDQMLRRRKTMTAQEHKKAENSLLDDEKMSDLIKDATFVDLSEAETCNAARQIATLATPQQIFARKNRVAEASDDPDADLILTEESPKSNKKNSKKRQSVSPTRPAMGFPPKRRIRFQSEESDVPMTNFTVLIDPIGDYTNSTNILQSNPSPTPPPRRRNVFGTLENDPPVTMIWRGSETAHALVNREDGMVECQATELKGPSTSLEVLSAREAGEQEGPERVGGEERTSNSLFGGDDLAHTRSTAFSPTGE